MNNCITPTTSSIVQANDYPGNRFLRKSVDINGERLSANASYEIWYINTVSSHWTV